MLAAFEHVAPSLRDIFELRSPELSSVTLAPNQDIAGLRALGVGRRARERRRLPPQRTAPSAALRSEHAFHGRAAASRTAASASANR